MAELAETIISYGYGKNHKDCADCGERRASLPANLPPVGDDFDWNIRDYDGFRLFMLEELAARFQERDNWAPADMEVVLVETLAVVLDKLSDMLDRVHTEAFLETARRPDSVRRLLAMIGYQPSYGTIKENQEKKQAIQSLEKEWTLYPHKMEEAKKAGPKSIHQQQRMVTLHDYSTQLELHPLVLRASAYSHWRGSWNTHYAVVLLHNNQNLDTAITEKKLHDVIKEFHEKHDLPDLGKTARTLLRPYIDQQRMAGQEVILQDAIQVGIYISISIRIAGDYFQSEIKDAVIMALSEQAGGYFKPGRLQFGEDVVASDIIETLMKLDGIEAVCLNLFKRMGKNYQDQSFSGRIELQGYEIAVCSNNPNKPENGVLKIVVHGGNKG